MGILQGILTVKTQLYSDEMLQNAALNQGVHCLL